MTLSLGTKTEHLYIGLFIATIGLAIGILALKEHKNGNFNIRPDIKKDCELVTSGIYMYVRHPMYLAVLLMTLGLAVIYASKYEFVLFVLLSITLLVKLFYEESLWKCHDPKYIKYIQKTKRLIPFVF